MFAPTRVLRARGGKRPIRAVMTAIILTAFFPGRVHLDAALSALSSMGFRREHISVLPKDVRHSSELGLLAGSKISHGAALGAITGGTILTIVGAALTGGVILLPKFGGVLVGPVVGALAGLGLGSLIGLIAGAIFGMQIPEFEALYLDNAIATGGSVLSVRCPADLAITIERILMDSGAARLRRSKA